MSKCKSFGNWMSQSSSKVRIPYLVFLYATFLFVTIVSVEIIITAVKYGWVWSQISNYKLYAVATEPVPPNITKYMEILSELRNSYIVPVRWFARISGLAKIPVFILAGFLLYLSASLLYYTILALVRDFLLCKGE